MNPMTPPDSVGKVVAEMLQGGGTETGWIGIDTARAWAARLQALDRQRQAGGEDAEDARHMYRSYVAAQERAETAEAALREAGRPVGYVYSEIVDTEGTQPVRIKRAVLQGEYAQSLPNGTPLYAALNGGQDDA